MEPLTDWPTGSPENILKQIYEDSYPWVESYIRQHSGNNFDAKDIFQESIAAAWINLQEGRFKGDMGQFNAYLRQICRYKWINQIRSGTRKKVIYNDALLQPEAANQDHDIIKNELEQSGVLQQSFLQLGTKCKEVLRLFYYRRMSLGEIADSMGNTEESIKTIKYRCMMQLRKFFLEEMKKNGAV